MGFEPITRKGEQRQCYHDLAATLRLGAVRYQGRRVYGLPEIYTLWWHSREQVAFAFEELPESQRYHPYWIGIGLENPENEQLLGPLPTQFNPPRNPLASRFASSFLRDESGGTHLAHSGRLRRGSGAEFRDYYPGAEPVAVTWPGYSQKQHLVIGKLGSPDLIGQLAEFARVVADFKSGRMVLTRAVYTPEFAGRRTVSRRAEYESVYRHGPVVSEIAKQLTALGVYVSNDRAQDLVAWSSSGRPKVLFEIKTSVATTDVYTGVGQLMLHGAAYLPSPRRVLVVPGIPKKKTANILGRLGIELLPYTWSKGQPNIPGLESLVRKR